MSSNLPIRWKRAEAIAANIYTYSMTTKYDVVYIYIAYKIQHQVQCERKLKSSSALALTFADIYTIKVHKWVHMSRQDTTINVTNWKKKEMSN